MSTTITATDPAIALAAREIELDNVNADLDAANVRAARNQEQAALAQQVQKLHEAADDIRRGALFQGGFSLAGAAASFCGTDVIKPGVCADLTKGAGTVATALAGPMARWTGEAQQRDDEADAKMAEAHVSDARARAEEAEQHRQRMEQASDRTLSTVDAILSSEAQGNLALIANV